MPKDVRSIIAFSDIDPGDNISDSKKRRYERKIEEFARTLDVHGLLTPMLVQEGGPSKTEGKRRVKLRVGFRRYFAIKYLREGKLKDQKTTAASWAQVEVKFIKGNERDNDIKNLVENMHREDLEPLEEALAMEAFMEKHDCNQAQLAREIAKSEPYVSGRLSLLRATTENGRAALEEGVISATHLRDIASLSKEKQDEMIADMRERIAKGEKISVAETHDAVLAKTDKGERKKTGRRAATFDQEKITVARDAYDGKKFAPRPRQALLEGLGTLVIRDNRNSSDKTSHMVEALEWVLGLREKL